MQGGLGVYFNSKLKGASNLASNTSRTPLEPQTTLKPFSFSSWLKLNIAKRGEFFCFKIFLEIGNKLKNQIDFEETRKNKEFVRWCKQKWRRKERERERFS